MTGYVNIAFPIPLKKVFTYSAGKETGNKVSAGKRAIVVFNRRKTVGFIVSECEKEPDIKVSEIIEVIDNEP